MKKLFVFALSFILIILGLPVAETISGDQLFIAEPLPRTVFSDKSVYLSVNTTFKDIVNKPIYITVSSISQSIPFVSELKGLDTSMLYLQPIRQFEVDFQAVYPLATEFSEGYEIEVKVINRISRIRSIITEITKQNTELLNTHNLQNIKDADIKLLSEDAKGALQKIQKNQNDIKELRLELEELRSIYNRYFEKVEFVAQLSQPSLNTELGILPVGTYKLRFIDQNGKLIKEQTFQIIERVPIKLFETIGVSG